MKKRRQPWARVLALALAAAMIMPQSMDAAAAAKKKVKLNKTKVVLKVGKKTTLKLKNNKKKVKWSSNKKKVATVTKKGVVKAKKKGTAKITAKVGKKKYVCKVTVKAAATKKSNKNTNRKNNSSKTNGGTQKVTGTPGKNVALNGDIFQIGGRNLTLGMTLAQVHTVLGSLSTDILRSEKSPQGFDVLAFRPNGNNSSVSRDDKFSTYILLYLKSGKVVGICGISKSMAYGSLVKAGTGAAALESSSAWSSVDWYETRGDVVGAGAYSTETSNANVLAFVDYYGTQTTYCIQAFDKAYSIDGMTNLSSQDASCTYSDAVVKAMATESGELLNAYLTFYGMRSLAINSKLSGVAQSYSNTMAKAGATDATDMTRSSSEIKSAIVGAGLQCGQWGERIMANNMDAIGFANSVIESNDARNTLISANYAICGIGASVYTKSAGKAVYYPNMVIDFIDKISTL